MKYARYEDADTSLNIDTTQITRSRNHGTGAIVLHDCRYDGCSSPASATPRIGGSISPTPPPPPPPSPRLPVLSLWPRPSWRPEFSGSLLFFFMTPVLCPALFA
ncbi:hypothetical protein AKJ16_DCAP23148 [Drosera capensis]